MKNVPATVGNPAVDDQPENLAALAAHELLEPLIAIEAYATLAREGLERGDDPATTAADLAGITRITARTRQLVESLLLDAGPESSPTAMEQVSLDKILADTMEVLATQVHDHDIQLDIRPLPAIAGDAVLLTSLFTNLLSNALTYGRRRGGHIAVDANRVGDEWLISITSDGTPIPAGEADAIFEPFRRGKADRRVGGHGLGLAICRRIAARHGGRIAVVPGNLAGNTFLVALPAQ
jgi:signal transduction histidine kinase